MPTFEPVIGLEIHAQLLTATKIFCGCSTRFGAEPNTQLCPVCFGLPGALPVLNRRAVELAIRAALALGCQVHAHSIFARKNYFYPDLPKGYQISAVRAAARHRRRDRVRRRRRAAHARHHPRAPGGGRGQVAARRLCRTPTARPISTSTAAACRSSRSSPEPDLRSPADAAEAFSRVREILVAIGVNDGNMEEGSLRCDANVSVRPGRSRNIRRQDRAQEPELVPPRAARARVRDRAAHAGALEAGGAAACRRRGSGIRATGRTIVMRTQGRSGRLPLLPRAGPAAAGARRGVDRGDPRRAARAAGGAPRRFVAQYQLPEYDAGVLTQSMALADYFERAAAAAGNAKAASNWVMGELTRKMNETRDAIEDAPLAPDALAELIVADRQGHDHRSRRQGRVREDVRLGPPRRARSSRPRGSARIDDPGAIDAHRRATCSPAMPDRWPSIAPARPRRSAFSSAR